MAVGERVAEETPDELLSFAPIEDGNGVEIVDHIERRHFIVRTSIAVSPQETTIDRFEFPVSRAFSIRTSELMIPYQLGAVVRNSLGFMVSEIVKDESQTFPADTYSIDPGAPVKTYIRFDSPVTISVSSAGIHIDFHEMTRVDFGVRSVHQQPAATITITKDVPSLMKAVSHFGSALKTTSCERSYPTLRGHPPTIEVGDRLDVPDVLSNPDTGIRIEVPSNYEHVFGVGSLAYYLGAAIVPGDLPRLVTETGFGHSLGGAERDFEAEVERVLKQVFFLDCITRTEGLFQVNLHERNEIEGSVDLDFSELYDMSIAAQLEAYLEVPHHLVQPYIPNWKLTAQVASDAKNAEVLPFLVNDLALIKVPANQRTSQTKTDGLDIADFIRGHNASEGKPVRSTINSAQSPPLIRVGETDSMEQTWIGEGAPISASKGMLEAFRNRLGRSPSEHDIDITVVCNASEMGQEGDLVNDIYGSREELPFEVTIHRSLTTLGLRKVLEEDTDFLHYIGHIDAEGFECIDGRFDAATLDKTGVNTFLLNACTSYRQGRELIHSGSIGGVVTLQEVINSGAERIGLTLAKLLNCGFPLQSAMSIAKNESIMGGHYLVLGDGGISITQPEGGSPLLYSIRESGDEYCLKYTVFPATNKGLGAIFTPHINGSDTFRIVPNTSEFFQMTQAELYDFIDLHETPIHFSNSLTWSSEFKYEELGTAPR